MKTIATLALIEAVTLLAFLVSDPGERMGMIMGVILLLAALGIVLRMMVRK